MNLGPDGRTPPHDLDAEAAVLSAVMIDNAALEKVRTLKPEHFYSEAHRRIFEAVLALDAERQPVEIVQVGTWLKNHERIVQVGGMQYLTEVLNAAGAVANVAAYATTVREKWRLRQLIAASQRIAAQGYLDVGDPQLFIDGAAKALSEIADARTTVPRAELPRLGAILDDSWDRAARRANGVEKPIPMPWPTLAPHFAGGLWPGVHYVLASTGVGKSQWALQQALHAARCGVPVAYVGLELEPFQIAMRTVGEQAHVPWSKLYTGQAGPAYLDQAKAAIGSLRDLPFHPVFGRPQGWPPSALGALGKQMRETYPETDGPGSRPFLLVLDFLQIIGAEPDAHVPELRERITQAAYQCRAMASELNAAVLVISSIARTAYGAGKLIAEAGLAFDEDHDGCPVQRRILNPDAIVGLGKESGDIEFSADSVSVLLKETATLNEHGGLDFVFATAKGRATRVTWSPLHFTGFRFEECTDRGGRLVDAWKSKAEKRDAAKEEKRAQRAADKVDKVVADAVAVARYVQANPGCSVRAARRVINDDSRRWAAVALKLGTALVHTKDAKSHALSLDVGSLCLEIAECLA